MTPREIVQERLAVRRKTLRSRTLDGEHTVRLRLIVFLVFAATALAGLVMEVIHPAWSLVPLGAFVFLIVRHERIRSAIRAAERGAAVQERSLARIEERWIGSGPDGERFNDPSHPYAADLDLFGEGSLFQRISVARTAAGEEMLASWLSAAAPPAEIRARQKAVAELAPLLDFREAIALAGEQARAGAESQSLRKWAAHPPIAFGSAERGTAIAISIFGIIALFAAVPSLLAALLAPAGIEIRFEGSLLPLGIAILAVIAFNRRVGTRVASALSGVEHATADLAVLRSILVLIEQQRFDSPRLRELTARLSREDGRASESIGHLERLLVLLDSRRNQFFFPFAALILWSSHLAFRIEAWRSEHGVAILDWIGSVAEVEAIASFGAFSFENPADPFPEIIEGGACFEAEDLGHPLIPSSRLVRNDLRLGEEPALLLVSGSNMSGKSTLLRTTGVAAVLAQAGAPVRAAKLTISPLAIGASIRLHDSLQEGASRFWAEIQRLRQLVDIASRGPLFFLLDEVLGGTNSHDRRIGADAVIRSLLQKGAIGLATTHDLSLAEIADSLGGRARNVHFEDRIDAGSMVFDYRLREGVVTRSNALELMKIVGLVESAPRDDH
ncbi:MAG TPA: DNA mismatch repair protein MutS [Thermoanaerobaculia bacterium]|nr:DNA mismatch repair protein MutS [Thermoanaerobaculia bacterium]